MRPVQIRLTKELVEKVDKMVEKGFYPNRSEAIRDAVRRLKLV
ncbi:MAG: ribbon-helix-helix domain-containing protein [Candidatus Aenigmatarchaeota archaeon]